MSTAAPITFTSGHEDSSRAGLKPGIDAMVLLGGTVRQTDLRRGIGRHILQLPISAERTILARWAEQTASIANALDSRAISLRIMLSPEEVFEPLLATVSTAAISIETDPRPTRGTGGVLRDLAADLPDDRLLLVANANQAFIGEPLEAVHALAAAGGDMALMPAVDGNGGFLLLTRCACLKGIGSRGFVDLKEQALPEIARQFDVRVVDPRPDLTPTSIRSVQDYLHTLLELSRPPGGADDHPLDEWAHTHRVVETGAVVAPDARVHNSVVLAGATVERGAVVARCILGPGARVQTGEIVRDRLVSPLFEEASA